MSPTQWAALVHSFITALKKVPADDRAFSFIPTWKGIIEQSEALLRACEQNKVPKQDLLEALRTYFMRSLSADRCGDNLTQGPGLPNFINVINKTLLADNPIPANELKPWSKGVLQTSPLWQSPASKRLLNLIKHLRFNAESKPLSAAERETPQWQQQVTDYLRELKDWDEDQESSGTIYFHQKSVLYRGVLNLMPPGTMRTEVLREYISFLANSSAAGESRAEWFLYVKDMLDRIGSAQDRAPVLEMLSDSGNSTLRLYADLSKSLTPPKQTQ
jgi:hypothetical protein